MEQNFLCILRIYTLYRAFPMFSGNTRVSPIRSNGTQKHLKCFEDDQNGNFGSFIFILEITDIARSYPKFQNRCNPTRVTWNFEQINFFGTREIFKDLNL